MTIPVGHPLREVPVGPLRYAFERSGMTKGELARAMGWTRPTIDRLNRALGYRPDSGSHRLHVRKPREHLSYDLANRLCEAIQADPYECGL